MIQIPPRWGTIDRHPHHCPRGNRRGAENVVFHQHLIEEDCVACHSDRRDVRAFRPIGRFSHPLLEPAVEQQCNRCHKRPDDALQGPETESNRLPAVFIPGGSIRSDSAPLAQDYLGPGP